MKNGNRYMRAAQIEYPVKIYRMAVQAQPSPIDHR